MRIFLSIFALTVAAINAQSILSDTLTSIFPKPQSPKKEDVEHKLPIDVACALSCCSSPYMILEAGEHCKVCNSEAHNYHIRVMPDGERVSLPRVCPPMTHEIGVLRCYQLTVDDTSGNEPYLNLERACEVSPLPNKNGEETIGLWSATSDEITVIFMDGTESKMQWPKDVDSRKETVFYLDGMGVFLSMLCNCSVILCLLSCIALHYYTMYKMTVTTVCFVLFVHNLIL